MTCPHNLIKKIKTISAYYNTFIVYGHRKRQIIKINRHIEREWLVFFMSTITNVAHLALHGGRNLS